MLSFVRERESERVSDLARVLTQPLLEIYSIFFGGLVVQQNSSFALSSIGAS